MTKCHKPSGLEQRNFILPHSGGQTSELRGSAGLVPSGGSGENLSRLLVVARAPWRPVARGSITVISASIDLLLCLCPLSFVRTLVIGFRAQPDNPG